MRAHDSSIGLIGFGNMGRALAAGWLADGIAPASIRVVDPSDGARDAAHALGIEVADASEFGRPPVDVAVVAVKPAHIEEALRGVGGAAASLYLSIAAGKKIGDVERAVGPGVAVVRAMPNTPAAVGRGVTCLCANDAVTGEQRDLCVELMEAVGSVEWIDDEQLMDAVTAVSGSGPAYVFLLIECLSDAARRVGLEPGLAERLALATVAGAGAYAEEAGESADELRRRVTSPNGTTEAALNVLMRDDALANLLREAVAAAERRSRELSSE